MRKETAFIIGFLIFTMTTAALIWWVALPNFKPVVLPEVASGTIEVGPMRRNHVLDAQDIHTLNDWLKAHKSGWGPVSRTPPSSGDARFILKDANGVDVLAITLWTGISAADWNDMVFVESPDGTQVHMQNFSTKEFAPLRMIVDGFPFRHSAFP